MYTVSNKDKFFIKDHDGDIIYILNKNNGSRFCVNRVGAYIFEKCFEFNDEILLKKHLEDHFIGVSKEVLYKDVDNILNLLEIYGIIEFCINNSDDFLMINQEPLNICALGDENYSKASRFINFVKCQNPFSFTTAKNYNFFSPVNLRINTINSKEFYLGLQDKKGEIHAILGIMPPIQGSSVLSISHFFVGIEYIEEDINNIIYQILEYLVKNIFKNITKIRLSYIKNENVDILTFLKILYNLGFTKECELVNEMEDKNMVMISKFI